MTQKILMLGLAVLMVACGQEQADTPMPEEQISEQGAEPILGQILGQGMEQEQEQAPRQGFLSAAPDVPLAPQLIEKPEQALIFDKAEGRIITMEAVFIAPYADSDGVAVLDFYRNVLPNLGWQSPSDGWQRPDRLDFARGHESLSVQIEVGRVVFILRPL